jgi:hypothetical protein
MTAKRNEKRVTSMKLTRRPLIGAALVGMVAFSTTVFAQATAPGMALREADLAKQLSNPISNLISVPLQMNVDFGAGPDGDGVQYKLNMQPVIPLSIAEKWNLITRWILPAVSQHDIIHTSSQSGLSDSVVSLFFSPKAPTSGGWIWGAGPVLLLPTATDSLLSTEKWGAGPTVVVLKQQGGWTYGALVNQIWSYAGESSRQQVNSTFMQPFVAYTTSKQTTFDFSTESSRDWTNDQWTVPLVFTAAQLVTIGKTPVQFQFAPRYYAAKPVDGANWGLRFAVVLLFPK